MKRVCILGAGISGLTLAWYLKKKWGNAIDITIVEERDRVGGWMQTDCIEGFLFERGPRSCRGGGKGQITRELAQEVGLECIGASPAAKRRYVLENGRLQALPYHPGQLLMRPKFWKLLTALWRERNRPVGSTADETVTAFFTRRFSQAIVERFVDPMTAGIYAGTPDQLSIRSCFPNLFQWERTAGSILKGMQRAKAQNKGVAKGIFSFQQGLGALPQAIARQLDATICLGQTACRIHCHAQGATVETDQRKIDTDWVFSTLPTHRLATLITDLPIASVPTATVVGVNLGYHKPVLHTSGFGYLVAQREEEKILGVVFDSAVFPHHNTNPDETRLRVMIGGTRQPELTHLSPNKLQAIALEAIERHLGIQPLPDVVHIDIAQEAIPQYAVGHHAQVLQLKTEIERRTLPLTLLGTSFYGVAVNDCVAQAKKIASEFCESVYT